MTAILAVENLHVAIPTASGIARVVRGVSLSVERGKTLCIVGESGSGKSMTALSLVDLLPPNAIRTAGRLVLGDEDLLHASPRRMEDIRGSEIAMVFQEPMTSLNPSMTIGAQLTEVLLRHRPATRTEARNRALYLLNKVGIPNAEDRLSQYPHQLSGGLRQRVMIAMALMCEPKVLIADEPTTALDVTIQAQVLGVVADLQAEMGLGLIFVTHDLGVVSRIADEVAVMYAGEIVETAPVKALFTRPSHPYTRALLSCLPQRSFRSRDGEMGVIPGMVPEPFSIPPGCAFAERCDQAAPVCRSTSVALVETGAGHRARCLFPSAEGVGVDMPGVKDRRA